MTNSAAEQTALIRARGLTKVYGQGPTAVHALRGVDLDIVRGEFVVLLGASARSVTSATFSRAVRLGIRL